MVVCRGREIESKNGSLKLGGDVRCQGGLDHESKSDFCHRISADIIQMPPFQVRTLLEVDNSILAPALCDSTMAADIMER